MFFKRMDEFIINKINFFKIIKNDYIFFEMVQDEFKFTLFVYFELHITV